MANTNSDQEFTGKTQEILDEIKNTMGMVPNFYKAQAEIDPVWLELNWNRMKAIMLAEGALDRKTKELIAMTVALVSRSEYCSLAHETMARMYGADDIEVNETKRVIELFASFTAIAESLRITCDITPEILTKES